MSFLCSYNRQRQLLIEQQHTHKTQNLSGRIGQKRRSNSQSPWPNTSMLKRENHCWQRAALSNPFHLSRHDVMHQWQEYSNLSTCRTLTNSQIFCIHRKMTESIDIFHMKCRDVVHSRAIFATCEISAEKHPTSCTRSMCNGREPSEQGIQDLALGEDIWLMDSVRCQSIVCQDKENLSLVTNIS